MYKIELVALLSVMTIALGLTYFIGYKLKKDYIINYKYSIFTVIIYNFVLLLLGIKIEILQIALENLVPVIGLFVWRNIYIEFHRSIKKDEKSSSFSIFVRVIPYIYLFLMSLSMLQLITRGVDEQEIIGAFHLIVIIGVLAYQVILSLEMFTVNRKLRKHSSDNFQHVFRTNQLALVVYMIVLLSNIALGTLLDNILVSGVMYTILVGFFFVNYVPNDFVVGEKIDQNKVIRMSEEQEHPNLTYAYDALTGMYTREYFIRHIQTFDENDDTMSVVVLSILGLKQINSSFGYEYGDEILQEITLIINEVFSDSTIARTDGSQLTIIQIGLTESEITKRINIVQEICSERDGFWVDIHFGYGFRSETTVLLYDIYKKAEEDLYSKRLNYNSNSQDKITKVLFSNFCMQMPAVSDHTLRCAKMAEGFSKYMGYSEKMVKNIYNATLLHDVALTMMPNMEKYELDFETELERKMYKNHTAKGYEMALELGVDIETAKGIMFHHECYDGSGFPYALKNTEIPLIAQIVSIVDMIDLLYLYNSTTSIEEVLKSKIRVAFSEELVYNMIDFLNKHY